MILAAGAAFLALPRKPPVPVAEAAWSAVEGSEGARVALRLLANAEVARQAFGMDLRSAGMLPVRVAIVNPGPLPLRIDAPQTFLIDRQGLAWPLLTLDQAEARLKTLGNPGAGPKPDGEPWTQVPETLTGFALDIVPSKGPDPGQAGSGGLGAWLRFLRDSPSLEQRVLDDLTARCPRIPELRPGQTAEGYLFFPGGSGEAQEAVLLRLGVALAGSVRVMTIPAEKL